MQPISQHYTMRAYNDIKYFLIYSSVYTHDHTVSFGVLAKFPIQYFTAQKVCTILVVIAFFSLPIFQAEKYSYWNSLSLSQDFLIFLTLSWFGLSFIYLSIPFSHFIKCEFVWHGFIWFLLFLLFYDTMHIQFVFNNLQNFGQ